jgi:hypothetical protein
MSYYPPPTENVAIFDEINFRSGEQTLTQAEADRRYLRYPNAQGTETLQAINVNGIATFNNTITAPGDLTLDPVGSITCNGKTIDMTGGEIHNCPLVHSQNNNDIFIEGKGVGSVVLKTNNVNRLTISDTGFQTFQGGATYNNATNTFTATTFSGTATSASTLNVTSNNSNVTCYPIYIGSAAGAGKTVYADDTSGPFSFNPNTGAFNLATTIKIGASGTGVVSIGLGAGLTSQGTSAVALGQNAGNSSQGTGSVAVGIFAGQTTQGSDSVAIGNSAGNLNQSTGSIAIGYGAGTTSQGSKAIAIGYQAGQGTTSGQGGNAIAIGNLAAQASQNANSICLNASGVATNPNQAGFFVRPIRGVASATPVCVYDAVNFEVTYNTSSIKYKKNVTDLSGDTSSIYNVRAREYDAKDNDKHFMGYIAEEVDAVDTRFTWKNPDGTPEGIEWFNMLIYTIEEMKKLKQEIEILKSR